MSQITTVAAADLGASSGRVMTGRVGAGRLELREVHRFPNRPVAVLGTLHWDILRLYADLLDGLAAAAKDGKLASVGIDSWGVDYGLLGAGGALLGNPVHYRDARTNGVLDQVLAAVPAAELYDVTGVQLLQINTACQLVAASRAGQLDGAATMLLIPDLLAYWLTGEAGAELTNASTTQLYDPRAGSWAWDVIGRLGLPRGLFPPLRQPGTVTGPLRPELAAEPGLAGLAGRLPVIAVGSHDTASAVVGVPAAGDAPHPQLFAQDIGLVVTLTGRHGDGVGVLLQRGLGQLRRHRPTAAVDHLEAGVAQRPGHDIGPAWCVRPRRPGPRRLERCAARTGY